MYCSYCCYYYIIAMVIIIDSLTVRLLVITIDYKSGVLSKDVNYLL